MFLADAAPGGGALIDRELYLSKSWTDDRARCQEAGVPDAVAFQTKPQQGQVMLERALAAGVPFSWVTGDTVYGGDRRLRVWLEQHTIPHVMAAQVQRAGVGHDDSRPGAGPRRAARQPG